MVGYYIIPAENFEILSVRSSVRTSAFRFRTLTWVVFNRFLQTLHGHWYRGEAVWDCKWAKFVYDQQLWPLIDVKMSFPDSNLRSFWSIFYKLCMDIDIMKEWVGIANRLNSFINNRVIALDLCKNVFFLNIFRRNGWISVKFCICIDKYKIHVVFNARYFSSVLTDLMLVIFCQF